MAIIKQYKVIEEVEIDFIYKNPSPVILCPQFENGERAIKVKLKNGGEDFTVPSGYTPHVYMLKFDKKVVDNICEYDGSTVMVKITKQMSFVEGRNLMRIALVSDTTGEYAQTCEIYLRVTEGADVAGAEHSTDEFEALVQYANQAKDSANKAAKSETNAKASETAAIAARKGAEDAEGRVQAIVAGNEAYTKQQSHDLFAAALVTKTGPASSLEVYPDKLSNLKVYALGFTQQAGTGDPSPTNVRALTNGGLKLVEWILKGTENFSVDIFDSIAQFKCNLPAPAVSNTGESGKYSTDYKWKFDQYGDAAYSFNVDNAMVYIRYPVSVLKSATDFKSMISARYAAGDPVIVWYAPLDESQATGLYAPIILQGGEYRATCLELTAPLCEGDSVVSWAKSGCDKVVVFDGSEDEGWAYSTGAFKTTIPDIPAGGYAVTVLSNIYTPANTDSTSIGTWPDKSIQGGASGGSLYVKDTSFGSDVSAFKAALAARPLPVWYRSTNYTEANDIAVSLETHVRAVLLLDGTENWSWNYTGSVYRGVLSGVRPAPKNQTPVCSHAKSVATTQSTNGVYLEANGTLTLAFPDFQTESSIADFKAYLAAQFAAGTPVTIVYELATPITYAHPAVALPALPDDTDKVTITGQSGGTVTVVFNKSIIKEIAEIKAAMLAMGANLSM